MGLVDKAKNKADQVQGQAKEQTGEAPDNEDLEADPQAEGTKPDEKPGQGPQHTEHPTGRRQAAENTENDPVS